MQVKGIIKFIDLKTKPNADKDFYTRSFGLDTSVEINGNLYPSFVGMQMVNAHCDLLDNYIPGDEVLVDFSLKGTLKVKPENQATAQNPNKEVIYTNVSAYKLEMVKAAQRTGDAKPTPQPETKKATRPDVIPDGMMWDEVKGELVKDDLPF